MKICLELSAKPVQLLNKAFESDETIITINYSMPLLFFNRGIYDRNSSSPFLIGAIRRYGPL
jgi:hypothetical protein